MMETTEFLADKLDTIMWQVRHIIQYNASEICGEVMSDALEILFGVMDAKELATEVAQTYIPKPPPKKRGRPPGSKNKGT